MIYKINSYYLSNRSKLLVIPTVVVVCIAAGLILNIGFRFSFLAEAFGKNEPDKSLPESYFLAKNFQGLLESNTQDFVNPETTTASIKVGSEDCILTESKTPENYSKLGRNVVYWKSEKCINLTGVGVVFKPSNEMLNNFSSEYLKKDLVLVLNKTESSWLDKLIQYSNTLSAPLNVQVKSFTVTAKDTFAFEGYTYYLDGVCNLKILVNCRLWRVNNKTGDFELIVDNFQKITEDLNKVAQDLSYSLRISSFVTSANSNNINILLTKSGLSKTWLVTIDSSDTSVVSFTDLSKGDKDFINKYFR